MLREEGNKIYRERTAPSYLYDIIEHGKDGNDSEEGGQVESDHAERYHSALDRVDHRANGERHDEIEGADIAAETVDGTAAGGQLKELRGGVEDRGDHALVEGARREQPPNGNRVGRATLQQAYNRETMRIDYSGS